MAVPQRSSSSSSPQRASRAGNKKRVLTRINSNNGSSHSSHSRHSRTSSSTSTSSSSSNNNNNNNKTGTGTGRKEILQLTLIGMAIFSGIYVFMFNKTIITMNTSYNLSDFYYYASTSISTNAITTSSDISISTTTTITNDTTDTTDATATNAIDDDDEYYYAINYANYSYFNIDNEEYEIQKKELQLWRQIRNQKTYYNEWFINKKGNDKLCKNADSNSDSDSDSSVSVSLSLLNHTTTTTVSNTTTTTTTTISVPPNNGPILDFVIAGFPKCGTTGLVNHLMHITPYGGGDICTPPDSTVYYAYNNWPNAERKKYPNQDINLKFLRGTKCPKFLETEYISELSKKLPKTRLLVGIRHPVLWFQSFYNMQMSNSVRGGSRYQNMSIFDELPHVDRNRNKWGCITGELFCVARSKFYLPLASLGKTSPMSDKEIKLLLSNDYKNDKRILTKSQYIRNPILLYEQQQPSEEYFWNDVCNYLYINRSSLPEMVDYTSDSQNKTLDEMTSHEKTKSKKRKFNICHKDRDPLRKLLLPISYNIYIWLTEYFIPASKIKKNDIYISNLPKFIELIKTYQYDPCNRLIRNDTDGNFYVSESAIAIESAN